MSRHTEPDVWTRIRACHPEARHFGEDYFLFDTNGRPHPEASLRMDTYGFFLCLSGEARCTIDLMPYDLREGMLVVNVPGQLVTHQATDESFGGTCLVMTPRFVEELGLPYNFGLAIGVREHPVLTLKPGELSAIRNYCDMVRGLLEKDRPYQAETLRHLTCAHAYSLGAYLYQMAAAWQLKGSELIMQRFLHEVRLHYRKERKLKAYAARLGLTPGHLSVVVREVSGKTASEWIDNFVLLEAKVLLRSTHMTIQQISDELHFPSQSFFGKYFKRQVGVSPKEYRDRS